ncbi:MAG: helix-turn-helix transcriptional regulator [Lachnospiraceae bacterium]|nr:helix-turn-helix transcriptional regulator [Lachnospiraceae bacterium]
MKEIDRKLTKEMYLHKEYQEFHSTIGEERFDLDWIKTGDKKAVQHFYNKFLHNSASRLSDNELQRKKYLFVVTVTLLTRALIQSGFDDEAAYTVSDIVIADMDRCTSFDMLNRQFLKMLSYYAGHFSRPQDTSLYAYPVACAVRFIFSHLHEPIQVKQVVDSTGLSVSYFSSLFKKETNYTILEFIHISRIKEAEKLLSHTDFTYTEISTSLCFCSLSHFISIFKKYTGITPKEFRMSHKYF